MKRLAQIAFCLWLIANINLSAQTRISANPIRVVQNIEALRALPPSADAPIVEVMGRLTPKDWGELPKRWVWDRTNVLATNMIRLESTWNTNGIGRWVHEWDGDVRVFGAKGDDGVDDTLFVQQALDQAMLQRIGVKFPAGVFHFQPWSNEAYATNVLVLGYTDKTGTNGLYSATHPDSPYKETLAYQSMSISGEEAVARRAIFNFTLPNDVVARGTTLVFQNMSNKVAIFGGNYQWGQKIKNLSIVGESYSDDSIAIRHGVGSSLFEISDVNIQWFGTAYAQGDDWDVKAQDIAADFNFIRGFKATRVDTGILIRGWNGYINHIQDCYISARIPIRNDYTERGNATSFSPKVVVTGGFIAPITEYGAVLITGTVVSASGTNVVVTNLTKSTKVRIESPYSLYLTNVPATSADIDVGMLGVIQGDTPITAAPDEWGVLREVVAVDSGTDTVSFDGTINASVGVGDKICIAKPAVGLWGDAFDIRGTHIEATQSEDFGFGPILMRFEGGHSPIVIDSVHVNLYGIESDWNRYVPKIWHKRFSSSYPSPLTIRNSSFMVTFGKMLLDDSQPVRLENNIWKNWPVILDTDGNFSDGIVINGQRVIMSTRSYWALATPELVPPSSIWWAESRTFSAAGVPVPVNRMITPVTSIGVSTEIASSPDNLVEGLISPRDNGVTGVYASQAALAIDSSATTVSNSYFATVTTLTNLFPGRVVEIAGAGSGGSNLVTRILETYSSPDNTTKGIWMSSPALTATTGAVTGVAVEWQNLSIRSDWGNSAPVSGTYKAGDIVRRTSYTAGSNYGWVCTADGNPGTWVPFGRVGERIVIGDAASTSTTIEATGGSGGADILRLARTSGTSQTVGFSLGAGSLIAKDVTRSANLFTATTNAFTPAATLQIDNRIVFSELASAPTIPATNTYTLYAADNGSGKTQIVVRWSDGTTNVLATQP